MFVFKVDYFERLKQKKEPNGSFLFKKNALKDYLMLKSSTSKIKASFGPI